MKRNYLAALMLLLVLTIVGCGEKEKTDVPNIPEEQKEDIVTEPAENSEKSEPASTTAQTDIKWEYTELDDGTISLYAYETEVIPEIMEVPSTVDGKTVTGISRLFLNEENVKKVILPETLTHIGVEAFRGSVSIEEVEINSAIEVINARAFYECSGIRSLTFSDGLKKIDDAGICLNKGLEELHVPGSIEMSADDLGHAIILLPETTIYAPSESAWETYAHNVGYSFAAE